MEWHIVQVILSHECCWFLCYRHDHSPYHRMFFAAFCNIHWRSLLSFPHLIIHPNLRMIWSPLTLFWFCFIVSNDKLLWPHFLGITTGCPVLSWGSSSFTMDWRCSIVLGPLMKETWMGLVCLSPRSHNGLLRSIIHRSVSFPLLRRPSLVIIPLWVVCWERAFNMFMIIARHGSWVAAHNKLPRSILCQLSHSRDFDFHSFSSPGFQKSRMICSKAPLQSGSSLVAISLWLVLLLNLVVIFLSWLEKKL